MENFVITNPYIHWPLFIIGIIAFCAPIPITMISSSGVFYAILVGCFLASLIWNLYLIPTFGVVMLLLFCIAMVAINFTEENKRDKIIMNCLLVPLFVCGVYSVNAFWVADLEESAQSANIKNAALMEKQFKDNTNERAMCKGLDFKKYKADGGDPATIDKCQKLLSEKPLSQQTQK